MEKTRGICLKNFKAKLSKFAYPFYKELPYICSIMLLMGGLNVVWGMLKRTIYFNEFYIPPSFFNFLGRFALLFLFSYIGATIITIIKLRRLRLLVKNLFYTIAIIIFLIVLFIKNNFNLEINPTCFVLLAETTSNESQEFVNQFIFSKNIIPTVIYALLIVLGIVVFERLWCNIKKRLKSKENHIVNILSAIIIPIFLFGLYSTNIYWKIYNAQSPDHIRFMYPSNDPITSTYSSLMMLNMMKKQMGNAMELNRRVYENVDSYTTQKDSINVVVVIGESYIKSHSSLYGYNLNTTPNLSREQDSGNLFVFNDVISSSNSTSVVMRNILCCNNTGSGEQWYNYPNFLTIFKKAGYSVYYWDNQAGVDKNATYSFTLNSFLYNNDMSEMAYTKINEKSYQYDKELIYSYKNTVGISKARNNLVLFHLIGQHVDPSQRFPHNEFKVFTKDSIKRNDSYLDDYKKEYIANYDNATLYNDYVLNEIINLFNNSNTILVYFSDHGEEIYDYRDRCGRDHGVFTANKLKYQYDVPFVIWCSNIFKEKNPDIVRNIKNAVDKPFIIDNVCNMLFNVAGIETPYYRDTLDIISPNYLCKDRILDNKYVYEEICSSIEK